MVVLLGASRVVDDWLLGLVWIVVWRLFAAALIAGVFMMVFDDWLFSLR